MIVLKSVYEHFCARVVEATRSLTVGGAHLPETKVSAVIDGKAPAKIQEFIEQGGQTARLLLSVPEQGYYVSIQPQDPLVQQEIFGPVLTISSKPWRSPIALILPSQVVHIPAHPVTAVGNLYINRGITGALVDRHPFGGFRLRVASVLKRVGRMISCSENTQRQGLAPLEMD